jgi:hypothetical protein
MKRCLKTLVPLMVLFFSLSGCSKDDDSPASGFDYPVSSLYGTWKITQVGVIDWSYETTTATFNSNGKYIGEGYFGDGTGTYTAKDSTIRCYISGELYCKYIVHSLSGTTAVLKMYGSETSSTYLLLTCQKE